VRLAVAAGDQVARGGVVAVIEPDVAAEETG
jgi:multidrug efflux pump subunit AcrA (membrane-fusion protein)